MGTAIFQGADENILRGAVWTVSDEPVAGEPTWFARLDPAARIPFGVSTVTVTATITLAARGDVLAVPVTNAVALTVSNEAGLNVSVPVPVLPRTRLPLTLVCDLSTLEPNPTIRTSTAWHFAFTGDGDLVLGAAIVLYAPRHALAVGDFQWGGTASQTSFGTVQEGEAGVRYLVARSPRRRGVKLTKVATAEDVEALQAWFDGSRGSYAPALLWPDPDVNDALVGTIGETLEVTTVAPSPLGPLSTVAIDFEELSKGQPV